MRSFMTVSRATDSLTLVHKSTRLPVQYMYEKKKKISNGITNEQKQ